MQITDADVLKYAIENGIIDTSVIQQNIQMQRIREKLKQHPYKVWQGTDGKWRTYLPDADKGRKLVKRNEKYDIEDVILEYWESQAQYKTIEDVFNEWCKLKLEYGEIKKQTYDRYGTDFDRFFKANDEDFYQLSITDVTEEDLEHFIKSKIHELDLTNKAYAGLRTIVMGVFKYAKKRKYTEISITNFFGDIDISKNAFKKVVKLDEDNVYTDSEARRVTEYIAEHETLIGLGIALAFETGMRVGEIAALKWEDIRKDHIYVHRTEERYKDWDGGYVFEVRDFPKSEAGCRQIVLTENAKKIIQTINTKYQDGSEWVFSKNGKRIKEKSFSVRIIGICNSIGINGRSMHKVRKTVGTKMLTNNVDEKIVQEMMGHSDISCTRKYYLFNNKNKAEVKRQVLNAITY